MMKPSDMVMSKSPAGMTSISPGVVCHQGVTTGSGAKQVRLLLIRNNEAVTVAQCSCIRFGTW